MSEETGALREMAANRGCRLRRSRRRKPGGDFGRFGLLDAKTGREVFGFGAGGLTATADEIRDFLRAGGASTWRTSLGKAGHAKPAAAPDRRPERSDAGPRPKRRPRPEPEPKRKREPAPAAEPEPKLAIRDAKPRDSDAIAALIAALGYEVTAAEIGRRLAALTRARQAVLVAVRDDIVGVVTTSVMPVLHRPRPVGRISMLVVAQAARGEGIGTALVDAAADRLRKAGCGLMEVTSNMKLSRAHGFYERLGFERTSYRFAKTLAG